jgi:hypothetical protein
MTLIPKAMILSTVRSSYGIRKLARTTENTCIHSKGLDRDAASIDSVFVHHCTKYAMHPQLLTR